VDDVTEQVKRHLAEGGATNIENYYASFDGATYTVTVSREPIHPAKGTPDFRWHISIAGMGDVPPWKALAAIGHAVRPGVAMCVPMPPRSQWMNYNPRVLHLYEVKDHNLTEQWRAEGRGHTPT
jgi:hypothetical protein